MAVDPATLTVINRYVDQNIALRQRVTSFVERAWGSLDSWRDADIDRFVNAVVPVIEAGQVQTAALTDAYLAAVESTITGLPVRPVGIPANLVIDEAVRGVATDAVYARTGPTVWTALSQGAPVSAAVEKGLQRAVSMASTDLQLAKTHSSRHVLSKKDGVVGYRRVLEGAKSCALCIVASSQRYHRDKLLPIHGGCDCGVLPIYGDRDPGQVIDPDTLSGVHDSISERFGGVTESARGGDGVPAYRDVLLTHEHGELGPILAVKGQAFTGPDDL